MLIKYKVGESYFIETGTGGIEGKLIAFFIANKEEPKMVFQHPCRIDNDIVFSIVNRKNNRVKISTSSRELIFKDSLVIEGTAETLDGLRTYLGTKWAYRETIPYER